MYSKVIALFVIVCVVQQSQSKALSPFWGGNPYFASPIDPQLQPIVSEVQMRLSQVSAISKSTIGMTVGLASKSVGMATSVAKTNLKTLINTAENNPNATKDCMNLNKASLDQLNTESKNQLSFCSKSSQTQLKAIKQVQQELSFQVASLNSELNMAVSQCRLENPLSADPAAVTTCVEERVAAIKDKLTVLEQNILNTINAVDTGVSQIVDETKSCSDLIQEHVQQQVQAITEQLDQCSVTLAV